MREMNIRTRGHTITYAQKGDFSTEKKPGLPEKREKMIAGSVNNA